MELSKLHKDSASWTFLSIIMLGIFLRFFRLGTSSLWLDEFLNFFDATHPFREMQRVILASPPLFHYVVRCFYLVFGKNDFWLRFPSALFGSISVGILFMVINEFSDRQTALWGTFLYAVSPMSILYSQELRMYSLLPLLALVALYFWELAMREDKLHDWALFTIFALAGLYTHNWFPFLVLSLGICSLGGWVQRGFFSRRGVASFFIVLIFYVPWLPVLFDQMKKPVFGHMHMAGFKDLHETMYAFDGIKVYSGDSWVGLGTDARALFVLLSVGLFFYGLLQNKLILRLTVAGLVLPLAFTFLISKYYRPIYFGGRYTVMCLPAYFLVISQAFTSNGSLRAQRFCKFFGILWISCNLFVLSRYYFHYQKAPWKTMAQWMNENSSSNDFIMTSALEYSGLAFDYYPLGLERLSDLKSFDNKSCVFMPVPNIGLKAVEESLPKDVFIQTSKNFPEVTILILGTEKSTFRVKL